jgi:hypothetical protein
MTNRNTRTALVTVMVGFALVGFVAVAAADNGNGSAEINQTQTDEKVPGLSSSLLEDVRGVETGSASATELTVMVSAVDGHADEAAQAAERVGEVNGRWGGLMEVTLRTGDLVPLSKEESVGYVREPLEPDTDVTPDDGAVSMNATQLHGDNVTGEGVEVAVVDQGFDTSHGPIQDNIASTTNLRSGNIDDRPDHGTASAESVVQVAPNASLHLYAVGTEGDILTAISDIEQSTDADIVTMSLSFKGGFPLDGTDVFSQEISESVNNGSYVWFNSAGNEADGNNWNGTWGSPQQDLLEFENGDTEMDVNMDADETLSLTVQWDDEFGSSSNDYDVYLYDSTDDSLVDSSENPQTGTENPVESIRYNGTGDYYFEVEKDDAYGLNEFDIFESSGVTLEHSTSARSLSIPATGEDVTTVGAAYYASKNLEAFSSQGPTIDGRLKPDLVGPDGVSTGVPNINPYYGTSAATPQTAGAAALLFDLDPAVSPEGVEERLTQSAVAVPNTPNEPNTQSGNGFVDVAGAANMSLNITNVDGSAGGANSPIAVETTVDLSLAGDIYDGPVAAGSFNVTVGNKSVDSDRLILLKEQPGRHTLRFVPPTQPGAGSYNLTVEVSSSGSDQKPDAITYSSGELTQTATSLQIDRSGSMSGIMDEAREGAVTFVEQAKDQDYVSVVSYADFSNIDQDLVRLEGERQNVTDVIRSLSSGGSTNIGDAMTDGLSTLDTAPEGSVQAGVLMTDGQRNEGPSESQILNSIVPQYNSQNVCLYTIGFTDGADEAFLREVAEASDCGYYEFAGEEGEVGSIQNTLQSVFKDIEGDIAGSDTLHSRTGQIDANSSLSETFKVDDTVFQATVNIRVSGADLSSSGDGAGSIQVSGVDASNIDTVTLTTPNGTEVDENTSGVNVSIVGDSVIYRIDSPSSGDWGYEIQNTQSQSTEYTADVTGASQTSLDVGTAGGTYYVGDEVGISATLLGTNGGISGADVEAVVTRPDGTTATVTLEEGSNGVYTGSVSVADVGEYTAEVTAETGSVSRVSDHSWTVEATAPISVTQTEPPRVTQGNTKTFGVVVEPDVSTDETVTLEASRMQVVGGGGASLRADVSRRSLNLSRGAQTVNVTVNAPKSAPAREYAGTVRVFRQDGTVVTEEVTLDVEPSFGKPLIDEFSQLPDNTQQLDDDLFEDLSGDGDGTDVAQTVRVFGELIRGNDLGLNDDQARALNWYSQTPETEVRPGDMVTLFGKQIRAK